jgi:hypothetical protein
MFSKMRDVNWRPSWQTFRAPLIHASRWRRAPTPKQLWRKPRRLTRISSSWGAAVASGPSGRQLCASCVITSVHYSSSPSWRLWLHRRRQTTIGPQRRCGLRKRDGPRPVTLRDRANRSVTLSQACSPLLDVPLAADARVEHLVGPVIVLDSRRSDGAPVLVVACPPVLVCSLRDASLRCRSHAKASSYMGKRPATLAVFKRRGRKVREAAAIRLCLTVAARA